MMQFYYGYRTITIPKPDFLKQVLVWWFIYHKSIIAVSAVKEFIYKKAISYLEYNRSESWVIMASVVDNGHWKVNIIRKNEKE